MRSTTLEQQASVWRVPASRARARLAVTAAFVGAGLLALSPAAAQGLAGGAVTAATPASITVSLGAVTPSIVTGTASLVVTGTVRNDGAAAIAAPPVRLVLGSQPLFLRADVVAWAAATTPAQGQTIGTHKLTGTIPPGAARSFSITVKNAATLRRATYGVLPLSIESGTGVLRTFAAYQQRKEYVPLSVSFLVPLTLDPDPELFKHQSPDRQRAWTAAAGATSRLDHVITATQAAPVIWAIDPLLTLEPVQPSPADGSTPTPSPTTTDPENPPEPPTVGGSTSPAEANTRAALSARIRSLAAAHTPIVLPESDADIAAATTSGAAKSLVRTQVTRAAAAAPGLGGRADIAWPADGLQSVPRERVLRTLYAGQGPAAVIAAQSGLPVQNITPDAARRSAGGLPILAYDDQLSGMFTATSTPGQAALSAQQFIADSLVLMDESPGVHRSVLVAAPRSFDPSAGAASSFLSTVRSVPWVSQGSLAQLMADAVKSPPLSPTAELVRPAPPGSTPSDPVASRGAALTAKSGQVVEATLKMLQGLAQIRLDGESFARTWVESDEQLTSARWRGQSQGWAALNTRVTQSATATARGVQVSPRNVNFLADSGRLQVTVVNTLNVPVHNITLKLSPDNPRLRVDQQPPLIHIGARSRATVVARVTSLSAGQVPITTTLTGPDGTVIGRGAVVRVQVSPTGDWVYWTLGTIAGTILCLGIWRSVRKSPRRAVAPAPVEEHTHA